MAFLTLNGISLGIVQGAKRKELEIGAGLERAYNGDLLRSSQAYKRQWSLSSAPMTQAESVAWVALLQSRHDHWNFNTDKYSDNGLVATSDTGTSIITSSPSPKYGAGCLNIASGTGNSIAWATGCLAVDGTVTLTVTVWRYESGAWHWYWITQSGGSVAVYKDGSSSAISLPSWLDTTSGNVTLKGIAGTAFQYDDLHVYPFAAPTSWQSSMYTFAQAQAGATSPKLQVGGDIAPVTFTAQARVEGASDIMGALSGAWADNLEPIDFELWES